MPEVKLIRIKLCIYMRWFEKFAATCSALAESLRIPEKKNELDKQF